MNKQKMMAISFRSTVISWDDSPYSTGKVARSQSVYFSVMIPVNQKEVNNTKAFASSLIQRAEDILFQKDTPKGTTKTRADSPGVVHPHRGIDGMRMFHSRMQRECVLELGSTTPGAYHFSFWV